MNECHPCIRSILLPMYPLDRGPTLAPFPEGPPFPSPAGEGGSGAAADGWGSFGRGTWAQPRGSRPAFPTCPPLRVVHPPLQGLPSSHIWGRACGVRCRVILSESGFVPGEALMERLQLGCFGDRRLEKGGPFFWSGFWPAAGRVSRCRALAVGGPGRCASAGFCGTRR
jgi:hypothetical protein